MNHHQHKICPEIFVKIPPNLIRSPILKTIPGGELPVYSMTAIDELRLKIPDALFNGEAVASLIENCIPDIKFPWAVPDFSINYLLIAIKMATSGENLEQEVKCPKCSETNNYEVSISPTLEKLGNIDVPSKVEIDDFTFTFKTMAYKDSIAYDLQVFNNQKRAMQLTKFNDIDEDSKTLESILEERNELKLFWLTCHIESVTHNSTQYSDFDDIKAVLKGCDRRVFDSTHSIVEKALLELTPEVEFECAGCQHHFKTELNLDYGFLFRITLLHKDEESIRKIILQYEDEAKKLKRDLLECVWHMRGGLSYSEILFMSFKERQLIGKIVDEHIKITKESKLPYF